ncbi:hypothetical protein ACA910_007394 [Epithemia clementina (nom. ined.)]
MDRVLRGPFTQHQIRLINCCRLFLGVRLLSDIATHDGRSLCSSVLEAKPPPYHTYKGLQPYQALPGPRAWTYWRRAISLFTRPGTYVLKQPLGFWVQSGQDLYREWLSYLTSYPQRVYIKKDSLYEVYIPDGFNLHYSGTTVPVLPSSAVPVELDYSSTHIRIVAFTPAPVRSILPGPPSSFRDFVSTLPDWEQRLLAHVQLFYGDVFSFVSTIQSAHSASTSMALLAASDGSAPQFQGTFGWVCALADGTRLASNFGIVYGYRTTSFRAELYGLLSFLRFLIRTHEYTAVSLPLPVQLYTDSKSAIDRLTEMQQWPYFYPNTTMAPDWDVLQAIVTSLHLVGPSLKLNHVRGHQDRATPVHLLSLPAQLNVEADGLASSAQSLSSLEQTTRAPLITGTTVQLHSLSGTITSRFRQFIRRESSRLASRAYLCHANHWHSVVFDTIDWVSHGRALRGVYQHRSFVIKFVHNWLPLGAHVSRYKPYYPASCPVCSHPVEDRLHFLQCSMPKWLGPLLNRLRSYQATHPTHPFLFDILCTGLRSWVDHSLIPWPSFPPSFQRLIIQQTRIGWEQLLFGHFSSAWADVHDIYSSADTSECTSGSTWVSRVIVMIWEELYGAWQHRNTARHGRDSLTRELELAEQAGRETAFLYNIRYKVLPRDRHLFYSSLSDHFSALSSSSSRRQWLLTWGPVILRSAQESTSRNLHHTPPISSFFHA